MAGFLLDENINPRLQRAIHRLSPDITVWRVGQPGAPALGTPDPEILIWCEANQVWLVTFNRKSMPVHLTAHVDAGHHVPGVFILSEDLTIGDIVHELILIAGASFSDEYVDQIKFIPLN